MTDTHPARRRKRNIVELRAAHALANTPETKKVTAEDIARLFGVPLESVLDPYQASYLVISADEEGRPVTPEAARMLDEYLDQDDDAFPNVPPITPEEIERLRANPGETLNLVGVDTPPVEDQGDDPDELLGMWNAFSETYRKIGLLGTAEAFKMEDLLLLARYNGVDTKGLRRKADVVEAIFA